jgi:hypothetical protein
MSLIDDPQFTPSRHINFNFNDSKSDNMVAREDLNPPPAFQGCIVPTYPPSYSPT